jgi:putative transposase
LSIVKQCELLGIARSSYYYQAIPESEDNLKVMDLIDRIYTELPFYGSRRMMAELEKVHRLAVNRKRIQRLMRLMGLEAIYPRPRLTQRNQEHRVFPYLLRNVAITRVNQVWSSDITYIRVRDGFLYLTAIMDWHSRYVLSWELSNTLEASFCVSALRTALAMGTPEIFNTDQGCQFTSSEFTGVLLDAGVAISMDGRGLHPRLRLGKYRLSEPEAIFSVLQPQAPPPGAWLPDPCLGLPGQPQLSSGRADPQRPLNPPRGELIPTGRRVNGAREPVGPVGISRDRMSSFRRPRKTSGPSKN